MEKPDSKVVFRVTEKQKKEFHTLCIKDGVTMQDILSDYVIYLNEGGKPIKPGKK